MHHSKWRTRPRWLTVPNLALAAFFAGAVCLYVVAYSKTLGGSSSSADGSSATGTGSGGMLAAAAGKQQGVTEADQDPPFHVVFSTSCSPFQDWQALLVFLSAEMVGQKVSQ